jgi:hypothetical protein
MLVNAHWPADGAYSFLGACLVNSAILGRFLTHRQSAGTRWADAAIANVIQNRPFLNPAVESANTSSSKRKSASGISTLRRAQLARLSSSRGLYVLEFPASDMVVYPCQDALIAA